MTNTRARYQMETSLHFKQRSHKIPSPHETRHTFCFGCAIVLELTMQCTCYVVVTTSLTCHGAFIGSSGSAGRKGRSQPSSAWPPGRFLTTSLAAMRSAREIDATAKGWMCSSCETNMSLDASQAAIRPIGLPFARFLDPRLYRVKRHGCPVSGSTCDSNVHVAWKRPSCA